ncbi:hypothetical protein [Rhizobium etli]|uniref:Uncharacterized protein n=1 Tax=Rhizobium etli TaxID=29449 RepID=A0A7W6ZM22_RHIET|nr:hypothetical protein [Rhizobium etli]MBB4482787.1 hypothetical protein [Rhizobium etli]MBB4538616.1 hypothetical protein [Rhizobium etli]
MTKVTDGINQRPKDETIAQTGSGVPDGSGAPIDASDEEITGIRNKIGAVEREEKEDLERQLARPKHGTA